jgi:hypothetical protein
MAADIGTLNPEQMLQQQQILRQQKMAEMLMNQPTPQGQMIGNRFVAPSFTQNLANLANLAVGQYKLENADQKQIDLAKRLRADETSAMADFLQQKEGQAGVEGGIYGPNNQLTTQTTADMYGPNMELNPQYKQVAPVAAIPPNPRGAYASLLANEKASPRLQNMAFTKLTEGPMKVGVEDTLLDPFTMKPMYQGAGKLPATLDVAVSLIPNLPRNRAEWTPAQMAQVENKVMQIEREKSAKNIFNMSDIMGKDLGQVQQIMIAGQGQVQTGELALNAANKIDQALKSKNLNVGPTATVGQSLGQIGDALGLVNQKGQEKLVNTRQAIQGLAQMWMAGRQQGKGQGPITEGENQLMGKISSGELANISIPELQYMVQNTKEQGNYFRKEYENKLDVLRKNPKYKDIVPLYEVGTMPNVQWNTGGGSKAVNDALAIVRGNP